MQPFAIALDLLRVSGVAGALRGVCAGVGALLTLHHVRPKRAAREFAPNRILDISPEYLEAAIRELGGLGYEFVSLDEFHARMTERRFGRRFVSFTLDDGYVDNFTYAYPIFRRHRVPFAIYLCSGIMDRTVHLWWQELEEMVARANELRVELDGVVRILPATTAREKYRAFGTIYWHLRAMQHEEQLATMQRLRNDYAYDVHAADVEPLTWEMVAEMHASGLFTIGAHTVNHFALSKLSDPALHDEMEQGRVVIRERTGVDPKHFAYPFGDRGSADAREFAAARELGFRTAVTTRKGIIHPRQAQQLHGIPRISLNGDYQRLRYLRTLMTGVPTAIYQRLRTQEATC